HLRQVYTTRHVNGDGIKPDGALHDRLRCAGFEHDQRLAASTEAPGSAVFLDENEADNVLTDCEHLGAVSDSDMDRAQRRGERQDGGGTNIGLYGCVDHFDLLELRDPDVARPTLRRKWTMPKALFDDPLQSETGAGDDFGPLPHQFIAC